jgi:hypothetical protein
MSSPTEAIRKELTLGEKWIILKSQELDPTIKKTSIAEDYNCSVRAIYNVFENKQQIHDYLFVYNLSPKLKRVVITPLSKVDLCLFTWYSELQDRTATLPVHDSDLLAMAETFATKLTIDLQKNRIEHSWIQDFKRRHGISVHHIFGEESKCEREPVEVWKRTIWKEITEKYDARDIFNADECALFWRSEMGTALAFKGATISGTEKDKSRITILLCCSLCGEKLPPLVIGHAEHPRDLAGVDISPLMWYSNTSAWMTGLLWERWLRTIDMVMVAEKRTIALIVDNAPTHSTPADLTNIELFFLPKNSTPIAQPLDAGIIRNFKLFYQEKVLQRRRDAIYSEKGELGVMRENEAIQFLREAWETVKVETIQHCWQHVGLKAVSGEIVQKSEAKVKEKVEEEDEEEGIEKEKEKELLKGKEEKEKEAEKEKVKEVEKEATKDHPPISIKNAIEDFPHMKCSKETALRCEQLLLEVKARQEDCKMLAPKTLLTFESATPTCGMHTTDEITQSVCREIEDSEKRLATERGKTVLIGQESSALIHDEAKKQLSSLTDLFISHGMSSLTVHLTQLSSDLDTIIGSHPPLSIPITDLASTLRTTSIPTLLPIENVERARLYSPAQAVKEFSTRRKRKSERLPMPEGETSPHLLEIAEDPILKRTLETALLCTRVGKEEAVKWASLQRVSKKEAQERKRKSALTCRKSQSSSQTSQVPSSLDETLSSQ